MYLILMAWVILISSSDTFPFLSDPLRERVRGEISLCLPDNFLSMSAK